MENEPCKDCGQADWDEYWGPSCRGLDVCGTTYNQLKAENAKLRAEVERLTDAVKAAMAAGIQHAEESRAALLQNDAMRDMLRDVLEGMDDRLLIESDGGAAGSWMSDIRKVLGSTETPIDAILTDINKEHGGAFKRLAEQDTRSDNPGSEKAVAEALELQISALRKVVGDAVAAARGVINSYGHGEECPTNGDCMDECEEDCEVDHNTRDCECSTGEMHRVLDILLASPPPPDYGARNVTETRDDASPRCGKCKRPSLFPIGPDGLCVHCDPVPKDAEKRIDGPSKCAGCGKSHDSACERFREQSF